MSKDILIRNWLLYRFTRFVTMISVFSVIFLTLQSNQSYIVEITALLLVSFVANHNIRKLEEIARLMNIDIMEYLRKMQDKD